MSLKSEFEKINNAGSCLLKQSQDTQKVSDSQADFGYSETDLILKDLNDEIEELKEELFVSKDKKLIEQELGDVIFVLCNLANRYGVDASKAIDYSTREFQRRMVFIEDVLDKEGVHIKDAPRGRLNELWKRAKGK